jgi:hypothetical protein
MTVFVIEDAAHAEWCGEYRTSGEALEELTRRSESAWDQDPNRAPCQSWATCGREYVVIEFDDQVSPWRQIKRTRVLTISASGVSWSDHAGPSPPH